MTERLLAPVPQRVLAACLVALTTGCGDGAVEPPPPPTPVPTTITVSPASTTLQSLGETAQLTAEVRDQNGQAMANAAVAWTSSAPSVATVAASGLVSAVANGAATVTATSGTASGTAAVTVDQVVAAVAVDPAADTLLAFGDTLRLSAEALDANGNAIADAEFDWSSSDVSVATVDASGLVTAVSEGRTTVTAIAGNVRGTAEIRVENLERAALVALYEATDGPNWVNSENWLTDAALGQWHGVHTDDDGRVRVLSLPENRLTGVIPSELGDLAALDHMNLSGNGLRGSIPPELGNLNRLVGLLLFRNALTGSIPLELASLGRLETLSLGGNRLTGAIPHEIGNLDALEALLLAGNQLTGPIPHELGNLRNLNSLQLFANGLTGVIPQTFGNLSHLTRLLLYGNRLTGDIPPELGNLNSLEWLWLDRNQLTGPVPTELGNLSSLRELRLHGNRLTGPIPPQLGNLGTLEWLTLSDNRLQGVVPSALGNLTALQFLRLSGNVDLFGPLPRSLINLGQLSDFPFHDTDLCAPGDPVFQNWLEGVGRWGGKICDGAEFEHRQALMAVYESAGGANWAVHANWGSDRPLNEWHGVTADTADRVIELDLSGNGLAGALSQDIGSLETLERLRLGANPDLTGDLPRAMVRLPVLEELGIEGTGLCIPPSSLFLDWLDGVGSVRGPRCRDDYGHDRETAAEAPLGGTVSGELDYGTDEDLFGVTIPREGTLSLRASGDARTRLELEDADDLFWGDGFSPWGIARRIPRGEYYIRVSGVTPNTTGAYSLELSFEPLVRARAYLTQAVQSHDGAVPLVAGEDALLRVFVTAPQGAGATMPPVRATFHSGGAVASVVDIPAGSAPVPAEVREDDLDATANAVISGSVLAPGLEMVVEIDPDGTLDPALGIGGRIPEEGRLALDVRRVPDFHVTAVPLLYAQDPDSSGFKATVGLTAAHEVFYETREWLPVANMEVAVREPLYVDYDPRGEDMRRALDDIEFLRVADGAAEYYMGVPPWVERGFLGIARIGGKSSVSRFEGHTVAHEFGHNLSLQHAPCGGPMGVDPHYPHRGGVIGGWGYDFTTNQLVDPEWHTDLMTYCRTSDWISDYSFAKAADYRTDTGASRAGAAADRVLIVRGGRRAGRLRLDPAFVLDSPPTLPSAPGPYRLSGTDASGRELFSYSFAMAGIADIEEDAASFVFAVPAPDAWAAALDRITLTGPEGAAELGRDGAAPERLVLDAESGRIHAILRGEEALPDAAADGRADRPARTLVSRGIPGAGAWRR